MIQPSIGLPWMPGALWEATHGQAGNQGSRRRPSRKEQAMICSYSGKKILERKEAKKLAKANAQKHGQKLAYYQCGSCSGWHLTLRKPEKS
jgi:hypothetical protein